MEIVLNDPQVAHVFAASHEAEAKESNSEEVDKQFKPPMKMKIICSYLYFIQGVALALPATMPLMYPELPPYWILSIFSAATLPFSFKFIEAPFIEKFTSVSYGKRKTWIMISQIMASIMLFISSFFTQPTHEVGIAVCFLLTILFITLQDISLDAMAIKQLKIPYLAGMTQAIMQTMGLVLGGLIFLKLTSREFAAAIHRSEPITTPAFLLKIISLLILVPTVLIHFQYKETVLDTERTVSRKNLCDIIKYYRPFLNPRSKYCRFMIMFLLFMQGFNFFEAGYEYELVLAGFKKNTINTITNIVLIPITILAIIVSPRIEKLGWLRCMMGVMIARWVLYAFLLATFPRQQPSHSAFVSVSFVSVVYFFIQALDTFEFILSSILINSFPVMGVSGMFITMLNSGSNFGQLKAPALAFIGAWNWRGCSILGLAIQVVVIGLYPRLYNIANNSPLLLSQELNESASQRTSYNGENGVQMVEVIPKANYDNFVEEEGIETQ